MRASGEGRGRWVLAVVVGCLALLALAPVAYAASPTGKISGVVTELTKSEDIIHLQNIEVSAYEAGGKEFFVESAITNTAGEYSIEGLPEGEYKVEFSGGFENGQNFVTQFYDNKSSFTEATPVKVVVGEPAKSEKINAEMEVGGEIEGFVTDAVTHKALAGAVVIAFGSDEAMDGFAITETSGRYTMVGLAAGPYKVEFLDDRYVTQYYNDQSSLASANPVSVMQGESVAGIDAALMPMAPINTAPPVASGTPM